MRHRGDGLRRNEHTRFESDLRAAVAECAIVPHYQPIVALRGPTLAGFEVLSRWPRPGQGPVAPDHFIPVAEETGLIRQLTGSVLERACLDARAWPRHLTLALNVSPAQIQDPGLPGQILAILGRAGFPAARLEIEVTETALVTELDRARTVLAALGQAGAKIAIDDFGTGYSGFHHLHELAFDKLKIDRSFVRAIGRNRESERMLDMILTLCGSLGLTVTAEGIETSRQAAWLLRHGCQQGQGFLFGRPMPAAEITGWLRTDRTRRLTRPPGQ